MLLFSHTALAGPVPDTGQTESYTDTFGEDSDYLINPPSYTKLGSGGNDLSDSATSWVMVRDNVTGLIWEVKTDDGSVHDKDNRYTWYDSNPATNGGHAGMPGDGTDTEDFIDALNAESFGGYTDWRLPTIKELASIVNLETYSPAIDTAYFPNTVSSNYWSSFTTAIVTGNALSFNFSNGYDYNSSKSYAYYVRAVRGGQTGSLDHLVINGDSTVTDTSTGLMWQQTNAESTMTWESAISYCEDLSLGGYTDWRLPNRKELRSIVDYNVYQPAIDTMYFPNTLWLAGTNYWSSSATAGTADSSWSIYFAGGNDNFISKSHAYAVRAVRGGQVRLLGHLVISSPEQGSNWNTGSVMPIRWDTQGISGNVRISISRLGGKDGTFETVIESTENDGTYDWTVNVAASVNCALKIEPVSDASKGTTQGLFSIGGSAVILPPTAATDPATAVTVASATLAGTVNPNGAETTVVFEWGLDTGYGNEATAIQSPLSGTTAQTVTADLTGLAPGQTYHYRISATNSAGTSDGADRTFTTPTTKTVRKAIIVAGSGPYTTNYLWEATKICAKYAYYALKDQGYTPDTIYFLSGGDEIDVDGDGIVDVDDDATNDNLEYAVKTWALGADNLFIYLVGHGRDGAFVMGEFEMLSAQDFDAWLDTAQDAIPNFVAILYDACRSGSFLPYLLPAAGKTRVLVASAGFDEEAIFMAEGDLSFGFHFFVHLHNGASFYKSFVQGKLSVEAAYNFDQNPLIEANGNGIGNEKEDKEIAAQIKVGLEKAPAGEIPRIQAVCAAQTLPEGVTEASIYAQNVEGEGISEVFAVIKPPNYVSGSPDNPVMDLPKIQLSPMGNRYQGTYQEFTAAGTYNIAIFAKDEKGFLSLPVQTTVTTYSPCLYFGDDMSIRVPCAEYQGTPYGFTLKYYRNPGDFLGHYWNLDAATLSEGSGGSCLYIGSDLSIPISCAEYNGTQYGFTLLFYPNLYDPSGLYWRMDMSTLEVK